MNTTPTGTQVTLASGSSRTSTSAFLLLAPLLSVLAVLAITHAGYLTAVSDRVWVSTVLLFWSPLPFSLPAVILESDRDNALASWTGLARVARAVALVPWLLLSPASTARVPMAMSLVGFATATVYALPVVTG